MRLPGASLTVQLDGVALPEPMPLKNTDSGSPLVAPKRHGSPKWVGSYPPCSSDAPIGRAPLVFGRSGNRRVATLPRSVRVGSVERALAFALEVPLRLQLGGDVVEHVVERGDR